MLKKIASYLGPYRQDVFWSPLRDGGRGGL